MSTLLQSTCNDRQRYFVQQRLTQMSASLRPSISRYLLQRRILRYYDLHVQCPHATRREPLVVHIIFPIVFGHNVNSVSENQSEKAADKYDSRQ